MNGSKRTRRKWKMRKYQTEAVRAELPRRNVEQQLKKDPEAPLVTAKRWFEYP